jgi:hypothetical protein
VLFSLGGNTLNTILHHPISLKEIIIVGDKYGFLFPELREWFINNLTAPLGVYLKIHLLSFHNILIRVISSTLCGLPATWPTNFLGQSAVTPMSSLTQALLNSHLECCHFGRLESCQHFELFDDEEDVVVL